MGNAQVPRVDQPSMLLTEFNFLVYQDVLGSYKLFKVIRGHHEREGLVVVKLFIRREGAPNLTEVQTKILEVKEAFANAWLYPNVVPYQGMEVTSTNAILLRQHFSRNLYDRMHTRPFLSDLTKNWIAFQVLCAVAQAHSSGVAHGDIKTENIFISSWTHAVLSDFAHFKPLFLPEDDPSEFSFFFESNLNRRRCYLAPERFDTSAGRSSYVMHEPFSQDLAAMDIFSLGCVLAELFLDGQTLMDLPELLKYRAHEFNLHAKLSSIKNEAVRELIGSMLQHDPSKRRPAIDYLREWCEKIAPRSFRSCLFPLSVLLLHPIYQQPDLRLVLIRHNFAIILWAIVGFKKLARVLEAQAGVTSGVESASSIWVRWSAHVKRHVRLVDEATLYGSVHVAAQAASQWAGAPAPASIEVDTAASGQSRLPASSSSGASEQQSRDGSPSPPTRLTHPSLREPCCERFTSGLLDHWEDGYKRCISSACMDPGETQTGASVYGPFITESCGQNGAAPVDLPEGDDGIDQGECPEPLGVSDSADVLSIVCAMICSSLQHVSNPRLKLVCLDMFEQIAPFTSQETVLEQIVPYIHVLVTDSVAKVRARAIDVLTQTLHCIEELPPSDTPLFMEYIFPQLSSAISGMNGEPIMLLAIARNIGTLAAHAVRFAELSVAAAQKVSEAKPPSPQLDGQRSSGFGGQEEKIEAFDVQSKHLREAVKKIVKDLLEYTPVGTTENLGEAKAAAGAHEESLLNLTMGREIKIALLRNMCVLADIFGRDGTHNFLLPYLISFMNDASWEVRAAFCEEAACLPRKVGQVSAEGIIWPCYEQALLDAEEHVLKAALKGLAMLVSQRVLKRQYLQTVASKVAPLFMHPSGIVRQRVAGVFDALEEQLGSVDQFVFVLPIVQPFLRFEVSSLLAVGEKLKHPLGRHIFKKVMLHRDEELCEALLSKRPLPSRQEDIAEGPDLAVNMSALDLFRPYVHPLLRSKPSMAQMTGAAYGSMFKDDGGVFVVPSTIVQSLQYATVNPRCMANRSLQALAELSLTAGDGPRWPCAVSGLQHPLGVFSMQTFLIQALCLPPRPRELGSLTHLDGTPYSVYTTTASKQQAPSDSDPPRPSSAGAFWSQRDTSQESILDKSDLLADPDLDAALTGALTGGLPGVAAAGFGSRTPDSRHRSAANEFYGLELDADDRTRCNAPHASWKPRGVLLATLYEYAHQSGVPVVKVDTTDDSRILVTGGKDGVVKIWNCATLESDVAVSSSFTFSVACETTKRRQRLRALRTVRNSKAFTVGCESGDVFLYRVEPNRANVSAVQSLSAGDKRGASAVMCIDHFDTELESLAVFAQQNGQVSGWDIRSRGTSWSLRAVPPWLGVPNCLSLGSDGHAVIVGTLGGGLLMYDLRFLAPWKQWKVSTGAAVMSLKSANHTPGARGHSAMSNSAKASADFGSSTPGVFVALGGDSNEVAFFDVVRGSCLSLFLTKPSGERQKEAAITVPSLLDACGNESKFSMVPPPSRLATGCVRSLWLPPRGSPNFLLSAGMDRRVRYWSLDREHHTSEAYVVTPPDSLSAQDRAKERITYSSNHLADVFVVQEQSTANLESPRSSSKSGGMSSVESSNLGPQIGTNPNHRDAILDMCTISLQHDILVTAGRDGLVKLWK